MDSRRRRWIERTSGVFKRSKTSWVDSASCRGRECLTTVDAKSVWATFRSPRHRSARGAANNMRLVQEVGRKVTHNTDRERDSIHQLPSTTMLDRIWWSLNVMKLTSAIGCGGRSDVYALCLSRTSRRAAGLDSTTIVLGPTLI